MHEIEKTRWVPECQQHSVFRVKWLRQDRWLSWTRAWWLEVERIRTSKDENVVK